MKKIVILFLLISLTSLGNVSFRDINKEHWAYRAVENLIEKNVWQENSDIFQGEREITRYEFAYYLSKTLNKLDSEKASSKDLVILENLVYEFAKELNKFGFDTEFYLDKVNKMEKTIEVLKEEVNNNKKLIERLEARLDKIEKK